MTTGSSVNVPVMNMASHVILTLYASGLTTGTVMNLGVGRFHTVPSTRRSSSRPCWTRPHRVLGEERGYSFAATANIVRDVERAELLMMTLTERGYCFTAIAERAMHPPLFIWFLLVLTSSDLMRAAATLSPSLPSLSAMSTTPSA